MMAGNVGCNLWLILCCCCFVLFFFARDNYSWSGMSQKANLKSVRF